MPDVRRRGAGAARAGQAAALDVSSGDGIAAQPDRHDRDGFGRRLPSDDPAAGRLRRLRRDSGDLRAAAGDTGGRRRRRGRRSSPQRPGRRDRSGVHGQRQPACGASLSRRAGARVRVPRGGGPSGGARRPPWTLELAPTGNGAGAARRTSRAGRRDHHASARRGLWLAVAGARRRPARLLRHLVGPHQGRARCR
jgi:hypothetical protein